MNSEIKKIVSNGYVPISVNIKYDKVNKRYDKKPFINDWNKLNLQTFRQHIKSNNKNYGILTGSKHNLLVIEIDVKDKGLETWNEWKEQYELDETVIVKTPTGGYHYYFTCDDETAKIYKTSRKSFEYNGERVGIDIRCNDGFVVVPPSSQGDKKYEWIIKADVSYTLEKDPKGKGKICDIELSLPGPRIFASSNEESFEAATDETIRDLAIQLKKYKGGIKPYI